MTNPDTLLRELAQVEIDKAAGWLKGGTTEFAQADAAWERRKHRALDELQAYTASPATSSASASTTR
jgi:hypothetical protein